MDKLRNKTFDEPESDGSSDSADKRKSIRRIGERFAEKTSMQGIPYIYHEKGILAKVIWTVLLLCAIGGMVYHLKFLIENYMKFGKSTKLELGRDNLQFPAVTICNTNIIKQRNLYDLKGADALKELVDALKPENVAPFSFENKLQIHSNAGQPSTTVIVGRGIQELTFSTTLAEHNSMSTERRGGTTKSDAGRSLHDEQDKPLPRVRRQQPNNNYKPPPGAHKPPLQDFNFSRYKADFNNYLASLELHKDEYDYPLDDESQVNDLLTSLYMDLMKKTRAQIGHNISEMLISCSFSERLCDYRQFHLHQTSEYGNCWTINSTKFVSSRAGPRGGMVLKIFLQNEEYLKGITNGYGIRLVIHHPSTFPFPHDEGIFIPAAMETSIGLKLRRITRIGPPYGTCNEGDQFKRKFHVDYTRQACHTTCKLMKVLNTCGCFEDGYEEIALSQIKDAHPCRSNKEEKCMIDLLRKFQRKEETCICLNPCYEVEYLHSISQRQWPSDEYAKVLLDNACLLYEDSCSILKQRGERLINLNFLKLNIYYEDLNFENVTETPDIEDVQFLSDVGGAIGLWIGLSLLSLCELGQLLIEIVICVLYRTKHSGERNEQKGGEQKNKQFGKYSDRTEHKEPHNTEGTFGLTDIK